MRDIDRPGWRQRAIEVRDQHANGGRCEECPGLRRRCPRWAAWFEIIAQLGPS